MYQSCSTPNHIKLQTSTTKKHSLYKCKKFFKHASKIHNRSKAKFSLHFTVHKHTTAHQKYSYAALN